MKERSVVFHLDGDVMESCEGGRDVMRVGVFQV